MFDVVFESNDISIYGVFDGHGGKEVSIFVEKEFKNMFVKLKEF